MNKFAFNPLSGQFDLVSDLSGYVPYTGATADVDLGSYNLRLNSIQDSTSVLSFDSNARKGYASDGTTQMFDYSYNGGFVVNVSLGVNAITDAGGGTTYTIDPQLGNLFGGALSLSYGNRIGYAADGSANFDWSVPGQVQFLGQISTSGIYNGGGSSAVYIGFGVLQDTTFIQSLDSNSRALFNTFGSTVLDWSGSGGANVSVYGTLSTTQSALLASAYINESSPYDNSAYFEVNGYGGFVGGNGSGGFAYFGNSSFGGIVGNNMTGYQVYLADGSYSVNAYGPSYFYGNMQITDGTYTAHIGGGGYYAGTFTDLSGHQVSMTDGTTALYATDGVVVTNLAIGGVAGRFDDGINLFEISNGTYAGNVYGDINFNGVSARNGLFAYGSIAVDVINRVLVNSLGDDVFNWDSGVLVLGGGSASSPSWTFLSDTTTGMYLPVGNSLGFSTAGVERVRIDNSGNVNITGGNLTLGTAGNKIKITEGTNATVGVTTLVAGVKVVNTTAVTANSRIFLTRQTVAGTPGTSVDVTARVAGTSFTITAQGSVLDTSTVAWLIIN